MSFTMNEGSFYPQAAVQITQVGGKFKIQGAKKGIVTGGKLIEDSANIIQVCVEGAKTIKVSSSKKSKTIQIMNDEYVSISGAKLKKSTSVEYNSAIIGMRQNNQNTRNTSTGGGIS